ncbi:MAG: hypothetical protein SGJ18_11905 [Pseudomonadota bacterium]|nr:hypothetical protein [Pseudomonadota bacterium]
MNFSDLKEKLLELFTPYWERVQESQAYTSLKEKFDSYPARTQKIIMAGVAAFLTLSFLFLFPFSYLNTASDSISQFEDNQSLIRRLLEVNRELKTTPQLPPAPSSDQLKSMIQSRIAGQGLIAEQVGPMEPTMVNMAPFGAKDLSIEGLIVSFKQLNLTQLVSLAFDFQDLSPSVKLVGLKVRSNPQDSHYFETTYTLASFNLPRPEIDSSEEPSDTENKRPTKVRRKPRGETE